MAIGTGNLPNQNMVFTPFDILTAEEQNQLVENIESLADGSGIGDEAITPEKLSTTTQLDGNGWSVGAGYWTRAWNNLSPGSITSLSLSLVVSDVPFPEGMSPSEVSWGVAASAESASTAIVPILTGISGTSTSTSDTFNIYIRNISGGTVNPSNTSVRVTMYRL